MDPTSIDYMMQRLREGGGGHAMTTKEEVVEPKKKKEKLPIQEGVDPDVDVEKPKGADLDVELGADVDVPEQESVEAWKRKTAGQGPGGSALHVPGSTPSSKGGTYGDSTARGATAAGTSGGGKGGKLPPTKKPETLEEYENRMVAEYVNVGEEVVRNAHGKDAAQDFLLNEAAQTEFAQKAALQSFNAMDAAAEGYASEYRTIGGAEVDVYVFDNGSEYYVDPDADVNNLQPGDVIRTKLPRSAE
jgi:hypothetical protein